MAFKNYEPDDKGFNEIARSPTVRAALRAVAEKGKAIAIVLSADFADLDADTDHYIDHFKVEDDTIDWIGQYPGRRAAANLVNDSDHAAAVEWGNSRDHKPHHVLGRTLDALTHG